MSRSICILFVALAIFQAVVAGVVEPREIVKFEMTEVASPNDLFGIERATCTAQFFSVGQNRPGDTLWGLDYEYDHNQAGYKEFKLRMQLPSVAIVHKLSAVSENVQNVVFCETPYTLGSSRPEVLIRMPPYSKAKMVFTMKTH